MGAEAAGDSHAVSVKTVVTTPQDFCASPRPVAPLQSRNFVCFFCLSKLHHDVTKWDCEGKCHRHHATLNGRKRELLNLMEGTIALDEGSSTTVVWQARQGLLISTSR
jgi:hypothetical protein